MKWLKTTAEIQEIRQKLKKIAGNDKKFNPEKEIEDYYEQHDDCSMDDYLDQNKFGKWLTVEKLPEHYEGTREKYEAFIGGFLYFFEKHVSKFDNDNRTLYFDWGKVNKKAELTIFLKPLYKKYAPYEKMGPGKAQQFQQSTIAPPPGTGLALNSIDPPEPPPPPPPPRATKSFDIP